MNLTTDVYYLLGRLKGADSNGSSGNSAYVITRLSRLFTPAILALLPLLILSNSAPKIWSSVNWLKGCTSSNGFQAATSALKDLPSVAVMLESSP